MAEDSDLEKTEQPTDSKLRKSREEGQIPRSKELTSVFILLVGIMMFWIMGSNISSQLIDMIKKAMNVSYRIDDGKQMIFNFIILLKIGFWIVLPIMLALVVVALIAPTFIGGLIFSTDSLKFDLKRLDPVSGFGKLFSSKIFAELLKGFLKVFFVGIITACFLWINFSEMLAFSKMYLETALNESMRLMIFCGLLVVFSLFPMVGFDVFYQIWSNLKKLKMTKQEIKDEYKEQEGDPQLKSRIKQMHQSMARRRMMQDVVKANVIITNPTHYAVALQYDEKKMKAPKVLAKGTNLIALKIKELAEEHRIPQLEAPPLARALYKHSEIGSSIPAELYAAVAQVLAWVYQLKRWHREGGVAPVKPKHLPVPDSLDPKIKGNI